MEARSSHLRVLLIILLAGVGFLGAGCLLAVVVPILFKFIPIRLTQVKQALEDRYDAARAGVEDETTVSDVKV